MNYLLRPEHYFLYISLLFFLSCNYNSDSQNKIGAPSAGGNDKPRSFQRLTDKDHLNFKQFTIDEGLCSNKVSDVIEDSKGYIWIATDYGLTKYDGVDFTCYQYDTGKENEWESLISNEVTSLAEGKNDGRIWVLTEAGLCYYSYSSSSVEYKFKEVDFKDWKYSKDKRLIEIDNAGNVWCNDPLGFYNPSLGKYFHVSDRNGTIYKDALGRINIHYFPTKQDDSHSIVRINNFSSNIDTLVQDTALYKKKGTIRFSNKNAYAFINDTLWVPRDERELNYLDLSARPDSLNFLKNDDREVKGTIFDLYYSEIENVLWIGDWAGLIRFDLGKPPGHEHRFRRFKNDPTKPSSSITRNEVSCVKVDKQGRLWVGLIEGGLCMYHPKVIFDTYTPGPQNVSHFSNTISDLVFDQRDSSDFLYVATNNGLYRTEEKDNSKFTFFENDTIKDKRANTNWIKSMVVDTSGEKLYLAYWGSMPNVFNLKDTVFEDLDLKPGADYILSPKGHKDFFGSYMFINDVFIDHNNKVWYSSWGGKLLCYDPVERELIHFGFSRNSDVREIQVDSLNYETGKSSTVYVTKENYLLLGNTDGKGLQLFDLNKSGQPGFVNQMYNDRGLNNLGGYITYEFKEGDTTSISNNFIQSIYQDSTGNIWIGTKNGLNKMTIKESADSLIVNFERFGDDKDDHLLHPNIVSIIEDDSKRLWLGSLHGLYEFEIDSSKAISNYTYENGLQSNEFLLNSCAKNIKGNLVFGGVKGYNYFYPESPDLAPVSKDSTFSGSPVNLLVDGKPLTEYPNNSIINYPWREEQYLFKLSDEFITQKDPKKSIEHKLDKSDNDFVKKELIVYEYSDLKRGEYTFKLRGFANDYIEDIAIGEPLRFSVKGIYETKLAIVLYWIIGFLIIFGLLRYYFYAKPIKDFKSKLMVGRVPFEEVTYIEIMKEDKNKHFEFSHNGILKNKKNQPFYFHSYLIKYENEIITDKIKHNKLIPISEFFWVNPNYVFKWEEKDDDSNMFTVYFKGELNKPFKDSELGYFDDFVKAMFEHFEKST